MKNVAPRDASEIEAIEQREWLESLDYVVQQGDRGRVQRLLASLRHRARSAGVSLPFTAETAYVNTLRPADETPLPGSREIERRIKSLVRWNAMAMVVRANRLSDGIGGHISTFASAATLYEVGFNHFFRGPEPGQRRRPRVLPGPRLARHLRPGLPRGPAVGRAAAELPSGARRWRRALVLSAPVADAGLLAVPHGLDGPRPDHVDLSGAVQPLPRGSRPARSRRTRKVWAFLGDGETDEPESLGAISLAAREKLDNLIFVINCNLQRLDGPVRGNGTDRSGARGDLPRRRLERHQGAVGQRLGSAAGGRPRRACSSSGWARSSTVSIRSTPSSPVPTCASTSSASDPRAARDGQAPVRRSTEEAAARRPRSGQGLQRPTRPRSSTRGSRRSSWRGRSRATASAKPAKARTSRTSRRS